MLKWVDKVEKGWQYMKNLIEEKIKKIEARKSKKMNDGGNVENEDDKPGLFKFRQNAKYIQDHPELFLGAPKIKNGGDLSKTPAPVSERIKGSKTNPKGSAKDSKSANSIKFDDKTIASIQSLIDEHNQKHPSARCPCVLHHF